MNNMERERYAFQSALTYALIYLFVFGGLLILLAPQLGLTRPLVVMLALLAAVLGIWHGIRAHKAKSKQRG